MDKKYDFRLDLFGGFHLIDRAGGAVNLGPRKVKAIFAWLACNPDIEHPREKVAALFWPDSADGVARHSLRQALASMRKVLPEGTNPVRASRDTILFESAGVKVDALAFDAELGAGELHAAEKISELYQGEFLLSCNPRSDLFEEWLDERRGHYRERATNALCQRLTQLIDRRSFAKAIPYAMKLINIDPLRESAYRGLMIAYMGLGNNALALRWYRRCEQNLISELGVQPCLETRALHAQLMHAWDAEKASQPLPKSKLRERKRALQLVSKDRHRVLYHAESALTAIADHIGGQTILLRGDSEQAMSKLLEGIIELARLQGFTVCRGRIDEIQGIEGAPEEFLSNGGCDLASARGVAPVIAHPDKQLASCIECTEKDHESVATLLILENIDTAGKSTLERVGQLISSIGNAPVLLVMTQKHGGAFSEPTWQGMLFNSPLTTIDIASPGQ